MSITDAVTNLSTTYTERPTVTFTAGTLNTIANCVTEVEGKLKRGTLSASSTPTSTQVQNWLIRAKMELAEVKGFTWRRRYATVDTATGTFRYALPPDYDGGRVVLRDTTNDHEIHLVSPDYFDTTYPDPSADPSNQPEYGTIRGMELWLYPVPNAVLSLELEYDRSGDDNTQTDFSWLPQIERFRCCDFACAEAFESLHQYDVADRFMQKWSLGIGKAIRADGKRKWKAMAYQAMGVFEHHYRRFYQG
jgi:hypothetical protein